ncbi:hypothetical protein [Diaphorobacter sp.]|uniref:hypothetical protein n=1 Tax=Diaphorobacter sp. TaxID=1934310 RepID=UPI002897925C|nr:hypothetical protein [Diaphorobacter sp.]
MRIHVTLHASTTVSVDDELMALLGATLVQPLPTLHANAAEQLRRARRFVQTFAKDNRDLPPDGLSRAVQRAIFRRIASAEALVIFDARDSEEAKARTNAANEAAMASLGLKPLTPEELAQRQQAKEQRAAKREMRRTEAAITAVTTPGAKVSHEELMRAGAAILGRPMSSFLSR